MHNKKWKMAFIRLSIVSFVFTSCVNSDYDFNKDIDLNLNVGGKDLAIPFGTTDSITLKKIIKLDESELLRIENGEYSLVKEAVIDPVTINAISPVRIDIANMYSPDIKLPFSKQTTINVPDQSIGFKVYREGMPQEVVSIKQTSFSSVRMTLKFTVQGNGITVDKLKFQNFKIAFPDFIVFKSGEVNDNNELLFNGDIGTPKILNIESFNFAKEGGVGLVMNNHIMQIEKNMIMSGNILLSSGTSDAVLKCTITVDPITLLKVEGQVSPAINFTIDPIVLKGIPDFLQDDNVVLDVENPKLLLTVSNEMDLPVNLSGVLEGIKNNAVIAGSKVYIGEKYLQNKVLVNPAGTTVLCLSRTGIGGPIGSVNVVVPDLSYLIKKIPDKITFSMTAEADKSQIHVVQLGKSYTIKMDYKVRIPFTFGENLTIVYKDTLDGFNDDIKDITLKQLVVNADVENNIPLELMLDVTPVDVNYQPLDISVTVSDVINPCDTSGKKQRTPIVITLKENKEGAINKLDGFVLNIIAKSNSVVKGIPLNENQYLKLTLSAKAPGGIKVDLNDK